MRTVGPSEDPDRYVLGAIAGVGGEGVVYRAVRRRPEPRTEVAIKLVRQSSFSDPGALIDQLSEVELARTISSPGLVPVLEGFVGPFPLDGETRGDVGREGPDRLFLVSEWIDGSELLEAATSWPARDAVRLVAALKAPAAALDAMHQGRHGAGRSIIHGDVNPANIIVSGETRAWLVDLGLARVSGTGPPGVGTRGFIAPEAARGRYTATTDRFGFVASVQAALQRVSERSRALSQKLTHTTVGELLDAEAISLQEPHEYPLGHWLDDVIFELEKKSARPRAWPFAASVVVAAIGGGLLAGLQFPASGRTCDARMFLEEAAANGVSWHDPDRDCLHSAYELTVTQTPVDLRTVPETDVPIAAQLAAIGSALLLDCEPEQWIELARNLPSDATSQSWHDPDRDCLHSAFEINALGTDPSTADTDGDGVSDTFDHGRSRLVHDPGEQLGYLRRIAGIASRAAVIDSVSCDADAWAALAQEWIDTGLGSTGEWVDSDRDCLADSYETGVTETDPFRCDTDNDGVADGIDPDNGNGLIEPVDLQLDDLGVGRAERGAGSHDQDPGSEPPEVELQPRSG